MLHYDAVCTGANSACYNDSTHDLCAKQDFSCYADDNAGTPDVCGNCGTADAVCQGGSWSGGNAGGTCVCPAPDQDCGEAGTGDCTIGLINEYWNQLDGECLQAEGQSGMEAYCAGVYSDDPGGCDGDMACQWSSSCNDLDGGSDPLYFNALGCTTCVCGNCGDSDCTIAEVDSLANSDGGTWFECNASTNYFQTCGDDICVNCPVDISDVDAQANTDQGTWQCSNYTDLDAECPGGVDGCETYVCVEDNGYYALNNAPTCTDLGYDADSSGGDTNCYSSGRDLTSFGYYDYGNGLQCDGAGTDDQACANIAEYCVDNECGECGAGDCTIDMVCPSSDYSCCADGNVCEAQYTSCTEGNGFFDFQNGALCDADNGSSGVCQSINEYCIYEFANPLATDDFLFMDAFYATSTTNGYTDDHGNSFDDLDDWLLNKAGGTGDDNPQNSLSTKLDGVFGYVKTNECTENWCLNRNSSTANDSGGLHYDYAGIQLAGGFTPGSTVRTFVSYPLDQHFQKWIIEPNSTCNFFTILKNSYNSDFTPGDGLYIDTGNWSAASEYYANGTWETFGFPFAPGEGIAGGEAFGFMIQIQSSSPGIIKWKLPNDCVTVDA